MNVENLLDEQIISKIYYGELYLSQEVPKTIEYKNLIELLANLSDDILNENDNDVLKKKFLEYTENTSIKEGIEAEKQFELG